MASEEIFEELHSEWLCRLDAEGYPLYLHSMYCEWCIRDSILLGDLVPSGDIVVNPESGEEIRDLPF